MLAFGIVGLELGHGGGKLRRIECALHMLVAHQRGQFNIKGVRFAVLARRWRLLAQGCSQSGGDLLQGVVAEVAFGG